MFNSKYFTILKAHLSAINHSTKAFSQSIFRCFEVFPKHLAILRNMKKIQWKIPYLFSSYLSAYAFESLVIVNMVFEHRVLKLIPTMLFPLWILIDSWFCANIQTQQLSSNRPQIIIWTLLYNWSSSYFCSISLFMSPADERN